MSWKTQLRDNDQFAKLAEKFGVDVSEDKPKDKHGKREGYENVRKTNRCSGTEIAEKHGFGVLPDSTSNQKRRRQNEQPPLIVTTISRKNRVRNIEPNYSASPTTDNKKGG